VCARIEAEHLLPGTRRGLFPGTGEDVVETAEENIPEVTVTKRKVKRAVRKTKTAVRKTGTRARKTAAAA